MSCLISGLAGGSLIKMKTIDSISTTQAEDEISTPKGKPSSFTKLEKGIRQFLIVKKIRF